jgi:predicted dehydrogenase
MSNLTRRRFVQHTAAGAALASLTYIGGPARASEPNKLNVACIGVRGRGNALLRTFAGQRDVRVSYICDVDTSVRQQRGKEIEQVTGHAPKLLNDYRAALDDKDVHAVVIGTPDHWHALPAIHACQAGKDVYVEKPDGHNIREGQAMVAAARKYDRTMQMGTQARSAPYLKDAAEYVKAGNLGKVLFGKAWETARQGAIPRVPDGDPPAGVDYDRWLGPAPLRPFNRYRFHGNWRWFFDYGTGDLGNDGVHRMDYCRAVMGVTDMPRTIACTGGKLFFDDAQEWPDTMIVTFGFGAAPAPAEGSATAAAPTVTHPGQILVYEMRIWSRPALHGHAEGAVVYGENGYVLLHNRGWQAFDAAGKLAKEGGDDEAHNRHIRNFIDAVRSRKREDLNQEIASGHVSSVMCHAGNIAWRTGLTLHFNAETETFAEKEANAFVGRQYRKGYALPSPV